jgi:hypothetical protein
MDSSRFPELIRSIYRAVEELESMFPGRHFTPDGHMIGSIGEAIAKHYYGVALYSASHEGHDGEAEGWQVQVKATQRKSIAITSEPDQLLVLRLNPDGSFVEEYNGPGEPVWSLVSLKPRPKNGQYQVSLAALRKLMTLVSSDEKLPRIVA